jgi:hypothetical protein
MDGNNEDEVRLTAHRLWEEAGRPDGRDQEFWFEALRSAGGNSPVNSSRQGENPGAAPVSSGIAEAEH